MEMVLLVVLVLVVEETQATVFLELAELEQLTKDAMVETLQVLQTTLSVAVEVEVLV